MGAFWLVGESADMEVNVDSMGMIDRGNMSSWGLKRESKRVYVVVEKTKESWDGEKHASPNSEWRSRETPSGAMEDN